LHLARACRELGLQIEFDKAISLPDTTKFEAPAQIHNLGSARGMLIFTNTAIIDKYKAAIRAGGYGYSVLSDRSHDAVFNIEVFKEMFSDWGWSGELQFKPSWMT
jgi:hypothetical protein